MPAKADDRPGSSSPPAGLLAAALAGLLLLALLGLLALQLYARHYADRVLPGVRLADLELGGLSQAEVEARLAELPAMDGTIRLVDPQDGRSWELESEALGLSLEPELLASQALRIGRDESLRGLAGLLEPLRLRRGGYDLAELVGYDAARARARLEDLAAEVAVPPENARVEREDGQAVAKPSTPGRALDVEATLAGLAELARRPVTSTLELATLPTAARIFDLENVAEAYDRITSSPIELRWREGQRFTVPASELAAWTSIEEVPTEEGDRLPSIILDREAMRRWLAPLADEIDHPPVEPRYAIDPGSGRFVRIDPGRTGARFDLEGSVDALIRAAYTEQRVGELAVESIPRQVQADITRELNTSLEEIGYVATGFAGSPAGRLQNLLVASERLDGLTLAPGQEASLLTALGEVSEAAGYDTLQLLGGAPGPLPTPSPSPDPAATAPGTTAPEPTATTGPPEIAVSAAGLTGGITQVASTLFRAAFWAGLPITERHAPPVRIGWLEPPIGLDATLFPELYDLRFVNDSPGYLVFDLRIDTERGLLECYVYGRPIEARRVEMIGPTVGEVLPAARPASLREPDLAAGESAQVGWAREGAAVLVERRVTVDGQARPAELFASRYAPAGDLVVIGTGP